MEDTSWLECIDENIIIYNKGEKINSKHKVINLPNIGMAGCTKLFHCIENYNNLADTTLFIQANPWDGDFELKYNFKNNEVDARKLINFFKNIPDGELISNNNFWQQIGTKYDCPSNYNQRHHNCFITYTHSWKEFIQEYIDPFNRIDWNNIRFYRNGHFSIKKEAILSNPIEYYIKLIDLWKYDVPATEWYAESCLNFFFNVGNDGKFINLGHEKLDFSNIQDYKSWMYELS